ncbi:uncharacterized protein VTP21DRAFT_4984 [Calcarisporiella thermophila]|uniref:uncharacterized protein n=1 Tax=Calcarisporiella thermophila TaxID=911321 RepID=UPI0037444A3C
MERQEDESRSPRSAFSTTSSSASSAERRRSFDFHLPSRYSLPPSTSSPSTEHQWCPLDRRHLLALPDGTYFSIDVEPSIFTLPMFRAMRNRILELEHVLDLPRRDTIIERLHAGNRGSGISSTIHQPSATLNTSTFMKESSSPPTPEMTWFVEQPGPPGSPRGHQQQNSSGTPLSRVYFTRFAPYNSPIIRGKQRTQYQTRHARTSSSSSIELSPKARTDVKSPDRPTKLPKPFDETLIMHPPLVEEEEEGEERSQRPRLFPPPPPWEPGDKHPL